MILSQSLIVIRTALLLQKRVKLLSIKAQQSMTPNLTRAGPKFIHASSQIRRVDTTFDAQFAIEASAANTCV